MALKIGNLIDDVRVGNAVTHFRLVSLDMR